MEIEKIKFEKDSSGFAQKVMMNEWQSSQFALVKEIAAKSSSSDDFVDRYLADPRAVCTQLYAVLAQRVRPELLWKLIRKMFGDREFKTYSDVGSLLVGDSNMTVLIPNGRGDGTTRVAVFSGEDAKSFNSDLMNFFTIIRGEINVFGYDCDDPAKSDPVCKLSGSFSVYYSEGFVALVKNRE